MSFQENQAQGIASLAWTPWSSSGLGDVETYLGESPLDGNFELTVNEEPMFFNTNYAGNNPTETRTMSGPIVLTVDLIESPALRSLIASTTNYAKGSGYVGGVNNGVNSFFKSFNDFISESE